MYLFILRHMFVWLCTYLWTPLPQVTDHTSHFSLGKWVGQSNNKAIKLNFQYGASVFTLYDPTRPSFPLIYTHTHNLYGWACLLTAGFYVQIKWRDRQNDVSGESISVDITIVHIVGWSEWRLWSLIYAAILFISCPNDVYSTRRLYN